MSVSQALWIDRVTLAAGVKTPVYVPRLSQAAAIGNGTGDDLKVYSHDGEVDDASHYVVIAAGFERPIQTLKSAFQERQIAFWLQSAPGGLVVILWL
jgi:hypothetical protein